MDFVDGSVPPRHLLTSTISPGSKNAIPVAVLDGHAEYADPISSRGSLRSKRVHAECLTPFPRNFALRRHCVNETQRLFIKSTVREYLESRAITIHVDRTSISKTLWSQSLVVSADLLLSLRLRGRARDLHSLDF